MFMLENVHICMPVMFVFIPRVLKFISTTYHKVAQPEYVFFETAKNFIVTEKYTHGNIFYIQYTDI